MIDDLPQFERMPLVPHRESEEREIFYPKWKCFCCHDSGLVTADLVSLVIPEYDSDKDLWVACQNLGCSSFSDRWGNAPLENFDVRFKPPICQKLDIRSRKDWRETVQRQIDIQTLAKKMAMPGSNWGQQRTENDNREAQQRKQEIERNFSTASLGGKEDGEEEG